MASFLLLETGDALLQETGDKLILELAAFVLSASSNISASGENTTAQLTAPASKTTSDFGGGRIQDDENPGDSVDIAEGQYREDEWSIEATVDAEDGETYQFRVILSDGSVLESYDAVAEWVIGEPATFIASWASQRSRIIGGGVI